MDQAGWVDLEFDKRPNNRFEPDVLHPSPRSSASYLCGLLLSMFCTPESPKISPAFGMDAGQLWKFLLHNVDLHSATNPVWWNGRLAKLQKSVQHLK